MKWGGGKRRQNGVLENQEKISKKNEEKVKIK